MKPMTPRSALLLASCLLVGCPSGEGDVPEDRTEYFEGELVATKDDGTPLHDPVPTILRRSLLPGQERIEEQRVELDADELPVEILVNWSVSPEDQTARLQYQDAFGLLEGFGSFLSGDVWSWTAWETQVEYQSGEYEGASVRTEARLEGGTLLIESEVISADGDLEAFEERTLQVTDESTYSQLLAELLGA